MILYDSCFILIMLVRLSISFYINIDHLRVRWNGLESIFGDVQILDFGICLILACSSTFQSIRGFPISPWAPRSYPRIRPQLLHQVLLEQPRWICLTWFKHRISFWTGFCNHSLVGSLGCLGVPLSKNVVYNQSEMPESTSSTDDLQLHHALFCMAIFKNRNGIQPESLNLVIHLAVMEVQLLLWPCLWNPWTSQLERNQKPWTQAMQKLEDEFPLTELWCLFVPWIVPDFRFQKLVFGRNLMSESIS